MTNGMQGGWCECGCHSMNHDKYGCTTTFCGCKKFSRVVEDKKVTSK